MRRLVLLSLILMLSLLSGCGGGSSASSTGTSSGDGLANIAAPPTGSVAVDLDNPAAAKPFPAGTVSVRIHVTREGKDLVPPRTVPMPPAGTKTRVIIDGVPIGPVVIVLEALSATGATLDTSSQAATVLVGLTVTATISVPVSPFSISPPSATAAPLARVSFTAVGGQAPYVFSLLTNASGGSLTDSGAYVAGAKGGVQDVILLTDANGATATAVVNVGPTLVVTPAAPTVPTKGTVNFSVNGGSGTGYAWSLLQNGSGGSINSTSGAYTAGTKPNTTDVVQVVDSLGNVANVTVTIGSVLSVQPATKTVLPGTAIAFTTSGGSGAGLQWTVSTNLSGATIDGNGNYTAGLVGGVSDVVTVTDSVGNSATATVSITQTLAVTPPSASVAPMQTVSLSASGGVAPYVFTMQQNPSGGSVTGTNYQAGATGSVTDVVLCTDKVGNKVTVNVTVGPALGIVQAAQNLGPQGLMAFRATGGSGTGFTWSLTTNNSGGVIHTQTGAYYAGGTTGTDTVQVVDSLGNVATANVSVSPITVGSGSTLSIAANTAFAFTASGGSGAYTYSIPLNNSGATVDATGHYQSGAAVNPYIPYDVVLVKDANGGAAYPVVVTLTDPTYRLSGGLSWITGTVQIHGTDADTSTWNFTMNDALGGVHTAAGPATINYGPPPGATSNDYISDSGGSLEMIGSAATGSIKLNGGSSPVTVTSGTAVTLDATSFPTPIGAVSQWQLIQAPFGNAAAPTNPSTLISTITPLLVAQTPFTGTLTTGSNQVTGISALDIAQLTVGRGVSHTALPAGTVISSISSTSITLSNQATASAANTMLVAAALNPQTIHGTTTSGSNAVTAVSASDVAQLYLGAPIVGAGIPGGATVASISTTSFTLSAAATANGASVALQLTPLRSPLQQFIVSQTFGGRASLGEIRVTP